VSVEPAVLDREPYCYLTTTGRRTGSPHTIEIWFAADEGSLYLLSGGGDRSDWVRNLQADPAATVRVADQDLRVRARVRLMASPERDAAIEALHRKYGRQVSATAEDWRRSAYIVALDVEGSPA
jgi:deazaflavin-dependent oxidoreductase (nitroreductase family)